MSRFKNGTYYLGRIIKLGVLNNEKLIDAILNPRPITAWGHAWTFINAEKLHHENIEFVYAKLIKYSPDAEVFVVDPEKGREVRQDEPNLSIASSPFVYIPEFSGIAFSKVSNHIEPKTFMKRFGSLIENKYDSFFVECDVEPISDLRSFAIKLSKLDGIYTVSANVYPPNPIFGPLWEDLKEYIEKRRADKMKIYEESSDDHPIASKLPSIVKDIAEPSTDVSLYQKKVDIGDAAILMAADGYGSGYVKGKQRGEFITIKTSETIKNFSFLKDSKPADLFKKVYDIFKKIQDDRHMKHSK